MDHLNTEGLTQVGEVTTRVFKEVIAEVDHRNAIVAGQIDAFTRTAAFVEGLYEAAGPYDDTRSLVTMRTWLGDRIREVQPPATMEDHSA